MLKSPRSIGIGDFWARPDQLPPERHWTTWMMLGGRGAGKTRAGAEWVRARVEAPQAAQKARRIALIGETYGSARAVMVEGPSGILAVSPPDWRPQFMPSRNLLIWPNGAEATLFSAERPDALRGPQFDAAWCDELAKWRHDEETWDMLQFGLRLGQNPQQVVTTTPRVISLPRRPRPLGGRRPDSWLYMKTPRGIFSPRARAGDCGMRRAKSAWFSMARTGNRLRHKMTPLASSPRKRRRSISPKRA